MSSRILEYFNFAAEKSPIHYIDPRGKFLFVIAITCLTILLRDLVPLAIIFGSIVPLIFLAKFFIKWLRTLLIILPLILLIILLNALLLKGEGISPTTAGVAMGIRFLILSTSFGIYFQTVSPDDISQMLVKFRFPYSLAWAISTAYRFIPTLAKESATIAAAQKARGLQIDRGNIFKRVRNMVPLLIPIFSSALRRSWQLAEAIESGGWNAVKKRTFLYSLKLKWWDYLVIILSLGIFAVFLMQAIKNFDLPLWMQWEIPYELKPLLSKVWTWFKGLFSN